MPHNRRFKSSRSSLDANAPERGILFCGSVVRVGLGVSLTKIVPTVVGSVSVDVVKKVRRVFSDHQFPDDPMRLIVRPIASNTEIPSTLCSNEPSSFGI